MARPVRAALVLLVALAGCATERRDVVVTVRITGDVRRAGTYAAPDGEDRAGIRTFCATLFTTAAPLPDGRVPYVPPMWQVLVRGGDRPPGYSFEFSIHDERRVEDLRLLRFPRLRMTAAGRVWESGEGAPFTVDAGDDLLTGRFRAEGVRPTDGGPDRITVEGDWTCPAPRRSP